ncbi:MAG: protein-glutamate O-methyltransferase CheR [Alphaproteobacteria bacterium]|nr:protein-glutamate O-methyltransferase CheR [Alphaproteobacteria bacterium]
MTLKTNFKEDEFEFPFTQKDFETLRNYVTEETGICLPDNKKNLMYGRLTRRLRSLNLENFQSYIQRVEQELARGCQDELMVMVNAMTTNVTHFFREEHHFTHLQENLGRLCKEFGRVNIWCAASSTGEEPWSIAMVVADYKAANPNADIRIFASDIDEQVLKKAKQGEYMLSSQTVESNLQLKKWLKKERNGQPQGPLGQELYSIKPTLKPMVSFQKINLLKEWPLPAERIHIVFCRNVIIYFSKETKKNLCDRIQNKMPSGGVLYLGHSESLLGMQTEFESQGRTVFTRQ